MKKLLEKNLILLLISLLLTGTVGLSSGRRVEADIYKDLPRIVYNDDTVGSKISHALYDGADYFGPRGSDSHIWFGDISNYNSNNGYHGDAYWRVVDSDASYNGTKGMMFLTSEFTFTPVRSYEGGMGTTYSLLFSDVEKEAMTTEGHEPDPERENFQCYRPTWYASSDKVTLSENNKLFSKNKRDSDWRLGCKSRTLLVEALFC